MPYKKHTYKSPLSTARPGDVLDHLTAVERLPDFVRLHHGKPEGRPRERWRWRCDCGADYERNIDEARQQLVATGHVACSACYAARKSPTPRTAGEALEAIRAVKETRQVASAKTESQS